VDVDVNVDLHLHSPRSECQVQNDLVTFCFSRVINWLLDCWIVGLSDWTLDGDSSTKCGILWEMSKSVRVNGVQLVWRVPNECSLCRHLGYGKK